MRTALLLLVCMVAGFASLARQSFVFIGREPKWITKDMLPYITNHSALKGVDGAIILDYENQISLEQQAMYYKYVIQLLSETGVQNNSTVSVSFDPSFQKLLFHELYVIRNGKRMDYLKGARFTILHRESRLEHFIYTGNFSAVLVLKDIQKGDIIAYSYTLQGFNPVFSNKFSAVCELQEFCPVHHFYYRVVTTNSRPLYFKCLNGNMVPSVTVCGHHISLAWSRDDLPAIVTPANVPSWFNAYPVLLLSEFKSWEAVRTWARTLFPDITNVSAALQHQVAAIESNCSTTDERIQAALRLVEDDIRYWGTETGVHTFRPHHPNQVFAQRYGDCKDKSYLLCTLLRKMGIEASPVLISTELKNALGEYLPSPAVFDHVTVRVRAGQRLFWLDPSQNDQRGSAGNIYFPDFQKGLVLDDTSSDLTSIPFANNSLQHVQEVLSFSSKSRTAALVVTTNYQGVYADETREQFKSNATQLLQDGYMDSYRPYFRNLVMDSLTANDDEKTGIFRTVEYYRLKEEKAIERISSEPQIYAYFLGSLLQKPIEEGRVTPLSVDYPSRLEEDLIVNWPKPLFEQKEEGEVVDPHFHFQLTKLVKGHQMQLKMRYTALTDYIPTCDLSQYYDNLGKALDLIDANCSMETTRPTVAQKSPGKWMAAGLTLTLAFLFFAIDLFIPVTWQTK